MTMPVGTKLVDIDDEESKQRYTISVSVASGLIATALSVITTELGFLASQSVTILLVAGICAAFQLPILHVSGIDTTAFGNKKRLFITFMSVMTWFLSYTLLLSA